MKKRLLLTAFTTAFLLSACGAEEVSEPATEATVSATTESETTGETASESTEAATEPVEETTAESVATPTWLEEHQITISPQGDFNQTGHLYTAFTYELLDTVETPAHITITETTANAPDGYKRVIATKTVDGSYSDKYGTNTALKVWFSAFDKYTGYSFEATTGTGSRENSFLINANGKEYDISFQFSTGGTVDNAISTVEIICPIDYDGTVFQVGPASLDDEITWSAMDMSERLYTIDEFPFFGDGFLYFAYEPSSETTVTPEAAETPEETDVSGMIFSHKDEYATELYNLIISLPEEKPASTLKQKDVDCDTLQWFNATYSMFTYDSDADYHLVGGYSDETGTVDSYVSDGLAQSWGITDRASAIESIAWLAYEGHAPEYADTLQMMYEIGMLADDENELSRIIYSVGEEEGWTEQECRELDDYYSAMRRHYEQCGENGIDAWDYCRIMQISGSCYYAGYLTLEESLTIQLATAKVIQDEFDSWDAMNTSYLRGYSYWSYGSDAAYAHRLWAYQDLQKEADCPFVILDFDMELEKFW